jgi:hypothetical protein
MRDEWREISLKGPPRLLVGWRERNHRLNAYRVKLHQDVYSELAALCQPAVDQIQTYTERPFENFAALEVDQYFWYAHATLPSHELRARTSEQEAPTVEDDTADLVRLVRSVDGRKDATRNNLDEGGYTFYAICWPHRASMIGFVSRINPVATLRPGYRYFQFGDALTTAARPDFALREGADLVIGAEGTAILSPFSFETLLGDVGVVFDQVPGDITAVKTELPDVIQLTPEAEKALLTEASRTRAYAKRLRLVPSRLKQVKEDAASLQRSLTEHLRLSLTAHEIDPNLLFDAEGHFSFAEQNVGIFLDVIEGRYFEDDLGGERRRADAYSTRKPRSTTEQR